MQTRGNRHPGMHHIVRLGRGFVLKPRDVVVLDIIPFGVEYIEDIEGSEPCIRFLEAVCTSLTGAANECGYIVVQ